MTVQSNNKQVTSMTGFGHASKTLSGKLLEVEIRSVNSRFLDIIIKCSDELRQFETQMRERIGQQIKRGKVELRLNIKTQNVEDMGVLQLSALNALLQTQARVQQHAASARPLSVAEILRWPGVVADAGETEPSLDEASLLAPLSGAIDALQKSRLREGASTAQLITQRVAQARSLTLQAQPMAKQIRSQYGERLRAKIEHSGVAVDSDRLAQELVLYAQKIDIDEEINRLLAHFDEVERVIDVGGEVGKRLDFLMQELNREANTLGSKSVDIATTKISIELKVLIEQIREQVQNLQ